MGIGLETRRQHNTIVLKGLQGWDSASLGSCREQRPGAVAVASKVASCSPSVVS